MPGSTAHGVSASPGTTATQPGSTRSRPCVGGPKVSPHTARTRAPAVGEAHLRHASRLGPPTTGGKSMPPVRTAQHRGFRRSPGHIRRVLDTSRLRRESSDPVDEIAHELRPIERVVLRAHRQGADTAEIAARLRRTPRGVAQIEKLATYMLEVRCQRSSELSKAGNWREEGRRNNRRLHALTRGSRCTPLTSLSRTMLGCEDL